MSDLQMDDHIQRPGIERVHGGTKEVQCGWSLRGGQGGREAGRECREMGRQGPDCASA